MRIAQARRSALFTLLIGTCALSGLALHASTDVDDNVRRILLASARRGEPSKTEQLVKYAVRSGVSVPVLAAILQKHVETRLGGRSDWESSEMAIRSVEILGALRLTNTLPVLRQAALEDGGLRPAAIRAIIRTGGAGMLEFARDVVTNGNTFSSLDRFAVYEELSPYVGVDAVQAKPIRGWQASDGQTSQAAKEFLLNGVEEETDSGNLVRLDRILCLADEAYPRSLRRGGVLTRILDSETAEHRKYATEQIHVLSPAPENPLK
jgi:hypothetical protein